jgi:hypothetical protein
MRQAIEQQMMAIHPSGVVNDTQTHTYSKVMTLRLHVFLSDVEMTIEGYE